MVDDNTIKSLEKLIASGSCLAKTVALESVLTGLAHPCANGKNWVVSQRLMSVRQGLTNDDELIAAILATEQALSTAWSQLIAARCIEAGELSDEQVLIRLISQLHGAAQWVDKAMTKAMLAPTGYAELERRLLGVTAEQSQATPVLTRVLAAASEMVMWQQQTLPEIKPVDPNGGRPDINWCSGRLIQKPGVSAIEFQYLLNGTATKILPDKLTHLKAKDQTLAVMDWVLANPWAYILALIVYEQNVWQVEAAGGLLLELPAGQSPHHPTEVQVLVVNADGDELYCGHLGTYVGKVLSSLNMGIFPAGCNDAEINAGLASVISALLANKVWRYIEGLSGEQGYYQIDPDFSDACYGRIGQPSFSRYARHLRQAIRSQAIQWRNDQQSHGLSHVLPDTKKLKIRNQCYGEP